MSQQHLLPMHAPLLIALTERKNVDSEIKQEEQIIANQEKIIDSREGLIAEYKTYTDSLQGRIDLLERMDKTKDEKIVLLEDAWTNYTNLVKNQEETLLNGYVKVFEKWDDKKSQAYEREITSLKERIKELEETVRTCVEFYKEQIEDLTGKAGSPTASKGKGKWKIVRDHEGGRWGRMLEGWCIVS
jgi:DNA repair exonuclease SbcCD ATPase subunit